MAKTILVFADGTRNDGGLLPDERLQAVPWDAYRSRLDYRHGIIGTPMPGQDGVAPDAVQLNSRLPELLEHGRKPDPRAEITLSSSVHLEFGSVLATPSGRPSDSHKIYYGIFSLM
jgi:hypothetical protein